MQGVVIGRSQSCRLATGGDNDVRVTTIRATVPASVLSQGKGAAFPVWRSSTLGDREQYLFLAISQVYRPDMRYAAARDMDVIRDACWKETALTIRYTTKGHVVSERQILPLAVMYTDRTLTVLAWCCLREAFRMFRTDRIIVLAATGTSFRPRRVTLLRTYLAELGKDGARRIPDGPVREDLAIR